MHLLKLSEDWNVNKIYFICNKLKNNKARDERGLIYELFKEEVAGLDIYL